jgi:hypothetical protein
VSCPRYRMARTRARVGDSRSRFIGFYRLHRHHCHAPMISLSRCALCRPGSAPFVFTSPAGSPRSTCTWRSSPRTFRGPSGYTCRARSRCRANRSVLAPHLTERCFFASAEDDRRSRSLHGLHRVTLRGALRDPKIHFFAEKTS